MSTEDLDRLLRLMLDKGLSHVSYSDGVVDISLTLPGGEAPVTARREAVLLCSRAIGVLLAAHPARPDETVQAGDRVVAGQPVAYIRSGHTLSAVTAEEAGIIGRQLGEYGRTVGYGAPVFEFFPDVPAQPEKG